MSLTPRIIYTTSSERTYPLLFATLTGKSMLFALCNLCLCYLLMTRLLTLVAPILNQSSVYDSSSQEIHADQPSESFNRSRLLTL